MQRLTKSLKSRMLILVILLHIFTMLGLIFYTLHIKHKSIALYSDLNILKIQIQNSLDEIKILKTELEFLTSPVNLTQMIELYKEDLEFDKASKNFIDQRLAIDKLRINQRIDSND